MHCAMIFLAGSSWIYIDIRFIPVLILIRVINFSCRTNPL